MAHTYSHLYDIPCIGMRFFTVYGPWGRPDMSPMIFTKAIFAEEQIKIFNNGDMSRSFTYIQDIIEIILKLINKPALKDVHLTKKQMLQLVGVVIKSSIWERKTNKSYGFHQSFRIRNR